MLNYKLLTKYANDLDEENVLKEYPRMNLQRDSYINLNGLWKYQINETGNIPTDFTDDILVPFPLESVLSKVNRILKSNEFLFYKKTFNVSKDFLKGITFINFNAVDQVCEVYLNDIYIGKNENGYLPFKLNVTSSIKEGENVLIVKVKDDISLLHPTGKQTYKRGGMWYTPVSGIWQSVFLESVNPKYIKNIKITPNIDNNEVKIEIDSLSDSFKIIIKDKENIIYNKTVSASINIIKIDDMKLWSPENPFLYDLIIQTPDDKITSYFAMRKFSTDNHYFLLNNKPYFLNGLLDQGYFSDGIYTPASYQAYIDDIKAMKELGFNTLRKHIKIEPQLFYYYCDTIGMIVMQDMVNLGKYSFFKDTLLPTIGFKKNLYTTVNKIQKEQFIESVKQTLDYLYNEPCIAYYTIFNEGWGQFEPDYLYDIVTSIDHSRVIDTTSGWFYGKKSDVISKHIYFKKIKVKEANKPIIISEFGGYSYKDKEHSFNLEHTYGYKMFKKQEEFEEAFIKLYENEIYPYQLAGAIYTQVSDVEDETNGLLSYDRMVLKVNKEKIRPVMEKIKKKVNENG